MPGRKLIVGYDNVDSLLIAIGLHQEIASQPAPQRDVAPVDLDPPEDATTAEAPTTPVSSEAATPTPNSLPTTPPVVSSDPAANSGDAIDRMFERSRAHARAEVDPDATEAALTTAEKPRSMLEANSAAFASESLAHPRREIRSITAENTSGLLADF